MSVLRKSIADLIQREAPGGPGGGQTSDPPADWREQLAARDQALAHSNSELERVRKESAGYRVGAKGQLAVHARTVAGLLGDELAPDAEPPAFDDLVPRLASALKGDAIKQKDTEIRGLKLRASLAEKFHDMGLKPGITRAALLDQGHMEKLSADVDKPDFDEIVSTVLEELAENMPEVKGSVGGPTRSSGQFKPNFGGVDTQISRGELDGMDPEEVAAALRSGKLDSLLGRR